MKTISYFILLLFSCTLLSQEQKYSDTEVSITPLIDGSLLLPENVSKPPLVIIIAGSGPTNRNGNQNFLKSNNLKKLAHRLADNKIASFRYDKRIVKQIKLGKVNVKDMRFDDFVDDAKAVVSYFHDSDQFSRIYLIGHSQGSLVAMLATDDKIDGLISLAGAGQNIGDVIVEQINNTARQFAEETKVVVEKLKKGETTTDFPPALASMFNMDTQPFMISWMAYEPTAIISELKLPILLVNGTKDLQVSVEEAKLLSEANSNAELKIIENMNHVLFTIEGDKLENSKSYNEAFRKLNPIMIEAIVSFINEK
ncbi:MAG: alpha/beta hydrolase [Winogradskyella sp.]|uniref:alpha/beta hydrolase n=1 Tax=Winogradskyella sp. TaxID=1883156 RepID=UPI000F40E6D8|nr:alpha/beta hydrolase [Winogradskyella sp.]RNC84937.1 MAG: alpha/beta hydrolase [Winogradskyella sp.]